MITTNVWSPTGQAESFESLHDLPTHWRESGYCVWVDLVGGISQETDTVRQAFDLNPATFINCELCGQRPRIDLAETAIFVLWYPLRNSVSETQKTLTVEALRLYVGENFLLTFHGEPIRAIEDFKDSLRSRSDSKGCKTAGFLFAGLLDLIIDEYLFAGEIIEDELEAMEAESLEMKVQASLLDRMRRLRRPLLEFHHLLGRHSIQLSHLLDAPGNRLPDAEQACLHHSQYHLKLTTDLAGRNCDTIAVIRENFNSSLANRMNAIMKTLTLFASLMLPLSFVVGFYGMNLPLWPNPQDPRSLIWITSGMAGITGLLVLFFWWRRWL